MDIVKRAYLNCKERSGGSPSVQAFHGAVIEEIKRRLFGQGLAKGAGAAARRIEGKA